MAKTSHYTLVLVESFNPISTSGRHGKVHVRPVAGQHLFPPTLFVECSKSLTTDYPVGTQFRIRAKLSDVKGTPFVYSYFDWPFEVVK